jgi:hypothetical protein
MNQRSKGMQMSVMPEGTAGRHGSVMAVIGSVPMTSR